MIGGPLLDPLHQLLIEYVQVLIELDLIISHQYAAFPQLSFDLVGKTQSLKLIAFLPLHDRALFLIEIMRLCEFVIDHS